LDLRFPAANLWEIAPGIIVFPALAYFALRIGLALGAEPSEEVSQLEQLRRPEVTAAGGDLDERVKRGAIGPAQRQGAQGAILVEEEGALLAPVLALADELELAPRQRMEGMRYPESSSRRVATGCI
jgi:hypothetical protein